MAVKLSDERYIDIENSYGGSQLWLRPRLRASGCGAVCAADLLLYMKNKRSISRSAYMEFVERIDRRYVHVIDKIGSIGLLVTLGLGRAFSNNGMALSAAWQPSLSGARALFCIEDMLKNDIPAIILINRNFFAPRRRVALYTERGASIGCGGKEGHFVTVTGLEEINGRTLMAISSWGRRYTVFYDELCAYSSGFFGAVASGVVYVKKR